jgi:hypothetical protein
MINLPPLALPLDRPSADTPASPRNTPRTTPQDHTTGFTTGCTTGCTPGSSFAFSDQAPLARAVRTAPAAFVRSGGAVLALEPAVCGVAVEPTARAGSCAVHAPWACLLQGRGGRAQIERTRCAALHHPGLLRQHRGAGDAYRDFAGPGGPRTGLVQGQPPWRKPRDAFR